MLISRIDLDRSSVWDVINSFLLLQQALLRSGQVRLQSGTRSGKIGTLQRMSIPMLVCRFLVNIGASDALACSEQQDVQEMEVVVSVFSGALPTSLNF